MWDEEGDEWVGERRGPRDEEFWDESSKRVGEELMEGRESDPGKSYKSDVSTSRGTKF